MTSVPVDSTTCSIQCCWASEWKIHLGFNFDQVSDVLIMVNCTVIHDNHTLGTRVGIQFWSLQDNSVGQFNKEASLTTCSSRNVRKHSLFTEPSKILRAIIPSQVRAGKTENRWPRTKAAWQTHALPISAQPMVHWFVQSSMLALSNQTQ